MAGLIDPNDLIRDMESVLRQVGQRVEESADAEYVGTAADGMVTAKIVGGDLEIDIHILAKRRMEPDDLGEAVVAAIADAEAQVSADVTSILESGTGLVSHPELRTHLREAMRSLRPPSM